MILMHGVRGWCGCLHFGRMALVNALCKKYHVYTMCSTFGHLSFSQHPSGDRAFEKPALNLSPTCSFFKFCSGRLLPVLINSKREHGSPLVEYVKKGRNLNQRHTWRQHKESTSTPLQPYIPRGRGEEYVNFVVCAFAHPGKNPCFFSPFKIYPKRGEGERKHTKVFISEAYAALFEKNAAHVVMPVCSERKKLVENLFSAYIKSVLSY